MDLKEFNVSILDFTQLIYLGISDEKYIKVFLAQYIIT